MKDDRRETDPVGAGPQDARWELPDYSHERELGTGASGRVVLARHRATGTPVAIKYLTGGSAQHASFRTEAELLAALRSPHVTRLYEYVEGPRGQAIVMELVDGISLRDLLRAEGATGPEAALTVLKGSLLGLAAAHRAGVVHRDYKPGNVLVTAEGESKLVDFGIAVRSGDSGSIAGTPAYMAPEQWAGEPASPATDVYAATATFFECLTGAKPYAGTTLMELAVQHTEAAIPDTHAPEALRPLIRAGLAKTPQDRPAEAEALVGQLEAVAGAAYGEDWEERGKRRLAALVALLPLLLPYGGEPAAGGTSFATTTLLPPAGASRFGRRAKLLTAATAAVLVGGTLAGVAVAGSTDAAGSTSVASPELTTSFRPVAPTSSAPTLSASPSPSASPSLSASPSDSASASASVPTKATAAPSVTIAPPPGPTTVPTTPAPPQLHVLSVNIDAFGCWGSYGTVASVTVVTDGAADGTLTLTWFDESAKGSRRTIPVATETIALPKGQTRVTNRYTHYFGDSASYWGVRVATSPAADQGQNTSQDLYAPGCIQIR